MFSIKIGLFLALLTFFETNVILNGPHKKEVFGEKDSDNLKGRDPDIFRNVSQLISNKGYPVEEHNVVTEDGYILGIQRIPHGKTVAAQEILLPLNDIIKARNNGVPTMPTEPPTMPTEPPTMPTEPPTTTTSPSNTKVVLVHHGLLSSSADFVIMQENESLGFILADNGYDVWLTNARGNTYSRKHKTLKPTDPHFWKFSWDEMAAFDLPATIDYILKVTGENQIHYVGHSMGTTIAFALLSDKPEYNDKLKSFMALAPVTTVTYMTSPLQLLVPFTNELEFLLELLGGYEFLPSNAITNFLSSLFCGQKTFGKFCDNIMFLIAGTESNQLNQSRSDVINHHSPAGSSTFTVVHYAQFVKAKKFQKFDYGEIGNIKKYNQPAPPEYLVEKITTPIALFWSANDLLADPTDVALLKPKIKNLIDFYEVPFPPWTHVDYIYGIDAKKYVFDNLLQLLADLK